MSAETWGRLFLGSAAFLIIHFQAYRFLYYVIIVNYELGMRDRVNFNIFMT